LRIAAVGDKGAGGWEKIECLHWGLKKRTADLRSAARVYIPLADGRGSVIMAGSALGGENGGEGEGGGFNAQNRIG
jgi:predicted LPLAT superfamily acyltransferase